nr:hypothetical protein [Actinomyces capricornis]
MNDDIPHPNDTIRILDRRGHIRVGATDAIKCLAKDLDLPLHGRPAHEIANEFLIFNALDELPRSPSRLQRIPQVR